MDNSCTNHGMEEVNYERFYTYILKNTFIPDKEMAQLCFCHLEKNYKEVIIARWGLDGTRVCGSEATLAKKTGVKNSYDLYIQAEHVLKKQMYAETLIDRHLFEPGCARALGILATNIVYDKSFVPRSYYGKKLLDSLEILTERERMVLTYRYGLDNLGQRKLKNIAPIMGVSVERVRQIESKALRKLRKLKHTFLVNP